MNKMVVFKMRLSSMRKSKGLNQGDLAELVGVTRQCIAYYEKTGARRGPSLEIAIKLADALGVSLDWLAGRDDEANDLLRLLVYPGESASVPGKEEK